MSKEVLSIRVEKEVKKEVEKILNELGLNLSTAVNIFLKAVLRERGIPFPLKVEDNFLTPKRHELKRIPSRLEKSLEDLERGRVEKFPLEDVD